MCTVWSKQLSQEIVLNGFVCRLLSYEQYDTIQGVHGVYVASKVALFSYFANHK